MVTFRQQYNMKANLPQCTCWHTYYMYGKFQKQWSATVSSARLSQPLWKSKPFLFLSWACFQTDCSDRRCSASFFFLSEFMLGTHQHPLNLNNTTAGLTYSWLNTQRNFLCLFRSHFTGSIKENQKFERLFCFFIQIIAVYSALSVCCSSCGWINRNGPRQHMRATNRIKTYFYDCWTHIIFTVQIWKDVLSAQYYVLWTLIFT